MKFRIVVSLLILFSILEAYEISGFVINEDGNPLNNVLISSESKAYISRGNGGFTIYDVSYNEIINFHKIGYEDKKFPAKFIPKIIKLKQIAIKIDGIKIEAEKDDEIFPQTADKIIIRNEKEKKYSSAADILSDRAELRVAGTSLLGERQTVSFGGFDARHTLVMIDGIPLNQSGEAFDLSSIPSAIIRNIEIINGGMGAMGGIININTKTIDRDLDAEIGYSFGSFGLDKKSASFSIAKEKYQLYTFFSRSFSRNNFKYEPRDYWQNPDSMRTRINNEKEIYDVDFNITWDAPFCKIKFKSLFQDFLKKLPGPTNNPELFYDALLNGTTSRNHLALSKGIKNFVAQLDLAYNRERTKYDNTHLEEPWASNSNYFVHGKNYKDNFLSKLNIQNQQGNFTMNYGADQLFESYKYSELTNDVNSIDSKSQNNYGVYANSKLRNEFFPFGLSMFLSGRLDYTSQFGNFKSWKIAPEFYYETLFKIIYGGLVSNGFTIPSFYNLYWKGDSQVTGNPDLIPEESLCWQLFTNLKYNRNFLKISYRADKLENMIIWFQDYNKVWKPMNLGAAEISNLALESEILFGKALSFNVNYVTTKAIDKTKLEDGSHSQFYGNDLIYTPEYSLNLALNYHFRNFEFGVDYLEKGKQYVNRFNQSSNQQLPSYDLWSTDISYSNMLRDFEYSFTFLGKNIFDKYYEIYEYMPQPGFNWEIILNVEYSFKNK